MVGDFLISVLDIDFQPPVGSQPPENSARHQRKTGKVYLAFLIGSRSVAVDPNFRRSDGEAWAGGLGRGWDLGGRGLGAGDWVLGTGYSVLGTQLLTYSRKTPRRAKPAKTAAQKKSPRLAMQVAASWIVTEPPCPTAMNVTDRSVSSPLTPWPRQLPPESDLSAANRQTARPARLP